MAAVQKQFKAGQYLFKEGQASNSMFLIRRGSVGVRKMKGNTFVEIARIYPNQVLGELSFFDRLPRSAAAVALTDVDALEIGFEALDKAWNNIPEYFRAIMGSVADRLRRANDTIRRLKPNQVDESIDVGAIEAEPDDSVTLSAVAGEEIKKAVDGDGGSSST